MTDILERLQRFTMLGVHHSSDTPIGIVCAAIAEIKALRERRDDLLVSNNGFEQRRRAAVGHGKVLALRLKQHETALIAMTKQYIDLLADISHPAEIREKHRLAVEALAEIKPQWREAVYQLDRLADARPISEYHEDMGAVLWWKFPIVEPPYVGGPNDVGFTVEGHVTLRAHHGKVKGDPIRMNIGGWPGYHTHFTPIPCPAEPKA